MARPGPVNVSWRAPSMRIPPTRRNGAEQSLDEGGPPDAIEPDEADDLSAGDVEGHGRGEPGDAEVANLEARRAGWVRGRTKDLGDLAAHHHSDEVIPVDLGDRAGAGDHAVFEHGVAVAVSRTPRRAGG